VGDQYSASLGSLSLRGIVGGGKRGVARKNGIRVIWKEEERRRRGGKEIKERLGGEESRG